MVAEYEQSQAMSGYFYNGKAPYWPKPTSITERMSFRWSMVVLMLLSPAIIAALITLIYAVLLPLFMLVWIPIEVLRDSRWQ